MLCHTSSGTRQTDLPQCGEAAGFEERQGKLSLVSLLSKFQIISTFLAMLIKITFTLSQDKPFCKPSLHQDGRYGVHIPQLLVRYGVHVTRQCNYALRYVFWKGHLFLVVRLSLLPFFHSSSQILLSFYIISFNPGTHLSLPNANLFSLFFHRLLVANSVLEGY